MLVPLGICKGWASSEPAGSSSLLLDCPCLYVWPKQKDSPVTWLVNLQRQIISHSLLSSFSTVPTAISNCGQTSCQGTMAHTSSGCQDFPCVLVGPDGQCSQCPGHLAHSLTGHSELVLWLQNYYLLLFCFMITVYYCVSRTHVDFSYLESSVSVVTGLRQQMHHASL